MALSGSLNFITSTYTGNVISTSVSIPANIEEGSQHYEHRGTTISIPISESAIVSESMDNAYLKIKNMNLWVNTTSGSDSVGKMTVTANYLVYGNQTSRSADIENYIDMKGIEIGWDPEVDSLCFSKVYAQLKDELGSNTLQDV
jgi:hypothetical protein